MSLLLGFFFLSDAFQRQQFFAFTKQLDSFPPEPQVSLGKASLERLLRTQRILCFL